MTLDEYKAKLKSLEDNYIADRKVAAKRFALANNPYKIDDIVTDSIGSIKIRSIGVYLDFDAPSCYYKGIELNKNGKESVKQSGRALYQQNIKPFK